MNAVDSRCYSFLHIGTSNKRVAMIRSVIREVAGFKPYERRIMELLKIGKDKRALKLAKARVCWVDSSDFM